jgi:hypothetical protein
MAKGPQYVKDFDFSVKPCEYSYGGKVKGYAKGGVVEKDTGERYPSKKVMMKREAMETPSMQREEVMRRSEVKGAIPGKTMRRSVPVAPKVPMIGMKKGGSMKMGKK